MFTACCSSAQMASIEGLVSDSLNNASMSFAEIAIEPGHVITYSNETGYYRFDNLPTGDYVIKASYKGCNSQVHEISLRNQEKVVLNLILDCGEIQVEATNSVLKEVLIESTRATSVTPMTYMDLSRQQIEYINTSQDIPQILRYTPSLVSTSDAGNGVGYTGLWIRGSDPSRINVTINGIPLNDPESQQVFWVNTPDLASSSSSIQIQRGVGTSANGAASFGGNIKIETRDVRTQPYAEIKNSFGSFNTMRNTVNLGTGLLKNKFLVEGRLSRIVSDGYIDRASSDLKSYFLEGNYLGQKTTFKLAIFGGREKTYQSWYGTPVSVLQNNQDSILAYATRNYLDDRQLSNMLNAGRTFNYYEYENQTDNYGQDHYQLHLSHDFRPYLRFNLSTHYTHGEGYYEEYKKDEDFASYGLSEVVLGNDTITATDLVRQRWLNNDFYGFVTSLFYRKNAFESSLGGAFNEYIGNHFGEIIWMEFAGQHPKDAEYYRGRSVKHDGNVYWRSSYLVKKKLAIYGDLQLRSVVYSTNGTDNDLRAYDVKAQYLFFNPKVGAKYFMNELHTFYASLARGTKEPNRNDFVDAIDPQKIKPEEMIDIEAGYQFAMNWISFAVNGYYMNYKNQLVLTGELNDVGAPLRMNVDKSFRRGLELQMAYHWQQKFFAQMNLTVSENKIDELIEIIYDYTDEDYSTREFKHNNTNIAFSPQCISGASAGYVWTIGKKDHELRFDLLSKYVGKQFLDNTQNDLLSIDPYFIQDLKLGVKLKLQQNQSIECAFFTHNLFDVMYSSNGYTYSYYYGSRITERFYYPQAGRNYSINLSFNF